MGESAGGAAIMHHLVAYGGSGAAPHFTRAVIQSPGFAPRPDPAASEARFKNFLQLAGCDGVPCLTTLPASSFYSRNQQFQQQQPFGTFAVAPVPDGSLVPAEPAQLLAQGKFFKKVDLLISRVTDEAYQFTPPSATSSANFTSFLQSAYWPTMPSSALSYLTNMLYPADYSGRQGYTTPFDRLKAAIGDAIFNCNTVYLHNAVGGTSHEYVFAVGRAQHGDDIGYTFYTEGESNPSAGTPGGQVLADRATTMQRYIVSFVHDGNPGKGFPQYGSGQSVLNVADGGVTTVADSVSKSRCAYWQQDPQAAKRFRRW